jgi:hypothetical protein
MGITAVGCKLIVKGDTEYWTPTRLLQRDAVPKLEIIPNSFIGDVDSCHSMTS